MFRRTTAWAQPTTWTEPFRQAVHLWLVLICSNVIHLDTSARSHRHTHTNLELFSIHGFDGMSKSTIQYSRYIRSCVLAFVIWVGIALARLVDRSILMTSNWFLIYVFGNCASVSIPVHSRLSSEKKLSYSCILSVSRSAHTTGRHTLSRSGPLPHKASTALSPSDHTCDDFQGDQPNGKLQMSWKRARCVPDTSLSYAPSRVQTSSKNHLLSTIERVSGFLVDAKAA